MTKHQNPRWKVLLIGGGSGTGKSLVARTVARHYGVTLGEVDDFRLMLQRITTAEQQPALHSLLNPQIWLQAPEALLPHMIGVAEIISHGLEIVIANHVATDAPIVLEGDGLLPQMAAARSFATRVVEPYEVQGVWVHEADEAQLWRNAVARGRGFGQHSAEVQQTQIRLAWLFGQWLKHEAERHAVPVLAARPWETLAARMAAAASQ